MASLNIYSYVFCLRRMNLNKVAVEMEHNIVGEGGEGVPGVGLEQEGQQA